jgi:hypothetical protein
VAFRLNGLLFYLLINPLGAFAFLAFGFAFAYGEGSPFIGWTHFALADLPYTKFGHVIIQVGPLFTLCGNIYQTQAAQVNYNTSIHTGN